MLLSWFWVESSYMSELSLFKRQLLARLAFLIDLGHVLVWWSAKQPCLSLVIDSGEPWGSAHLPAKWLLLQAVAALWIDWHKCQSLIRHGASSTFRTTPDACVSLVWSRAGRNQQRGNGRNRKDTCLRHLDSDSGCVDIKSSLFLCWEHGRGLWSRLTSHWIINKGVSNIEMYFGSSTHILLSVIQTAGLLCHIHHEAHKANCGSTSVWRENLCGIKMLTLSGGGQKETWYEIWQWSW